MLEDLFELTDDWDEIELGILQFSKIKTKVEIENIKIGTEFNFLVIDYTKGTIELQNDDNNRKFKFQLKIVCEC